MTQCRQKVPVVCAVGLAVFLSLAWPGYVLANTCGNAAFQLTQYAAQVNQIAQWEQTQGIPMRCGGNPMCIQVGLQQLQYWYSQQSSIVNRTYMQLAQSCNTLPGHTRPGPIDLKKPEEIIIDDENKEVVIKVPSTPEGFQSRR